MPLDCQPILNVQAICTSVNDASPAGFTQYFYAYRSDIVSYTLGNFDEVTNLTLASSKSFRPIPAFLDTFSVDDNIEAPNGGFLKNITATCSVVESTPEIFSWVEHFRAYRIVILAQRRDGSWRVYGLGEGLRVQTINRPSGAAVGDNANTVLTWISTEVASLGGRPVRPVPAGSPPFTQAQYDAATAALVTTLTGLNIPDFYLNTIGTASIAAGASGNAALTIVRNNSYAGTITFTLIEAPAGITSAGLVIAAGSGTTGNFPITVAAGTAAGSKTLRVRAVGGNESEVLTITVTTT